MQRGSYALLFSSGHLRGVGGSGGDGRETSSFRQVQSSIPAALCLRPWLVCTSSHLRAEGRPLSSIPAVICLRPWSVRSPSHLQAEGRPFKKFLPAFVQEGRQFSSGVASASSSFAWCWRRRRGDGLTPSGCVPGGEVAGFVLLLHQGLDRVFQFSFRVLFARSRDRSVISLFLSSLDVIIPVLMNI